MKPAQLLYEHYQLVSRERVLRDDIEQVTARLELDPEVVQLAEALAEALGVLWRERALVCARAVEETTAGKVRDSDHEREAHRTKLRAREKELMSGRIRNPTDLMQMSEEVKHMKARFAEEEDAEMRLMEDADSAHHAVRE